MTLLDLANFVCTKVNQTDATDLAACKGFLLRRRDLVWADALWKDSLFEYTQTVTSLGYAITSTWLPTKKTLLLPTQIDYVVAVRTDTRKLDIESSERLYRIDADTFGQSGQATQYRNLRPAVWEFDSGSEQVLDLFFNPADAAQTAIVDVLESDGITETRYPVTLDNTGAVAIEGNAIARIDALSKGVTTGNVAVTTPPVTAALTTTTLNLVLPAIGIETTIHVADGTVMVSGSTVIITDGANQATFQVTGAGVVTFHGIFLGAGGDSAAGTTINSGATVETVSYTSVLSVATADTVALKRCRIQLFGVVNDGVVLRVLGKARAPLFTEDRDEPGLTGIENCLIAFAQADMLERERQYGKAQAVKAEAVQLLEQLKRVQVTQQSHHKRFVPQEGYGPDYQIYNSPLTF